MLHAQAISVMRVMTTRKEERERGERGREGEKREDERREEKRVQPELGTRTISDDYEVHICDLCRSISVAEPNHTLWSDVDPLHLAT